jgi:hypothetical protein
VRILGPGSCTPRLIFVECGGRNKNIKKGASMKRVRVCIIALLISTQISAMDCDAIRLSYQLALLAVDNAASNTKIVNTVQTNPTAYAFVKSLVWNPPMITMVVTIAGLIYVARTIAKNTPGEEPG